MQVIELNYGRDLGVIIDGEVYRIPREVDVEEFVAKRKRKAIKKSKKPQINSKKGY